MNRNRLGRFSSNKQKVLLRNVIPLPKELNKLTEIGRRLAELP
jgi:hypothetical protein